MPPDAQGTARVREVIDNAYNVEREPPRPLMREAAPADDFPVDSLGGVLGAAAIAIHDRIRAPIAIGAQSVLAAAALSVQGHADVTLPIGSGDRRQAKPVSCYFMTVAATGERKSACDAEALWPVRKREAELRDEHDKDQANYTNDKLAWENARVAAIKRGKGSREAIRTELDKLGLAPQPPLFPILTCEEPTLRGYADFSRSVGRHLEFFPLRAASLLAATECPRRTSSKRPLDYRISGMDGRFGGFAPARARSYYQGGAFRSI